MEWVRRIARREEPRRKILNPEELANALALWRESNPYAWWLNENLDAVSNAVQRQMALVRDTRVAVAVQQKRDLSRGDKSRLVEGFDNLTQLLERVTVDLPAGADLWPDYSQERLLQAIGGLMEGASQAKLDFVSGEVASAHEGFKTTVEDWLFASVPVRYRLNVYMRETFPPEVLASLPPTMLPAEPPKALARYVRYGSA